MSKLPILDLSEIEIDEQFEKVVEEFDELCEPGISTEEEIEEGLDLIQATIGYLRMIANDEELAEAMDKHRQKLESRGHNILGYLEVSYESSTKA